MQSTPGSLTAYRVSRALAKQRGRTGGVMVMLNGLWEKDVTIVPACLDAELEGQSLEIGLGVPSSGDM